MRRRYRNPPIVELACEFQFDEETAWDLAMPGLIYKTLEKDFPKHRPIQHLDVRLSSTGPARARTIDRLQLQSSDDRVRIQVGPQFLAVNHLVPYASWEEFYPKVERAFEVYKGITTPSQFRQISLRYVNRIRLPDETVDLSQFFNFYPSATEDFGETSYLAFTVGVQLSYEDSNDTIRIQLTSVHDESEGLTAQLELHYQATEAASVELDGMPRWIRRAHDRAVDRFEHTITDRLREQFEEVDA